MSCSPLEVLARAEKRLSSHIAAHGIDERAVAITARYERLYAQALRHTETPSRERDETTSDDATPVATDQARMIGRRGASPPSTSARCTVFGDTPIARASAAWE